MKCFKKYFDSQEKRPCTWCGVHCLGSLLIRPASLLSSCLLIVIAGASLAMGCKPLALENPVDKDHSEPVALTAVDVELEASQPFRRVDIFFFEGTGIKAMCHHEKIVLHEPEPALKTLLMVPETASHVVAFANTSREFNDKALSRYDVVQQLEYEFADDSPEFPLMSAEADIETAVVRIAVRPVMCTVRLVEVCNLMEGYELVEEPRIRLRDMNMSAKPLQKSAFYPAGVLDAGEWLPLPCDVGYYAMKPDARLYCYPNETSAESIGSHTLLEMECIIEGVRRNICIELPPFGRESMIEVSLVIEGPWEYSHSVRVTDPS